MIDLPPEATVIDPELVEVGVASPYQRLVYGRVERDRARAFVVVQLVDEHPQRIGVVGRFYGGVLEGGSPERFVPRVSYGIGEVQWEWVSGTWVPVESREVQPAGAAA